MSITVKIFPAFLATFTIFSLITESVDAQNGPVDLYQHIYHKGEKRTFHLNGGNCIGFPIEINDWVSSIDTNEQCVSLCRDYGCKYCEKFFPGTIGHDDFTWLKRNDYFSAMRGCRDGRFRGNKDPIAGRGKG